MKAPNILFVISSILFLGSVGSTQEQKKNTWIELYVTNNYLEALPIANVLNFQFNEIGIVTTENETYAVVSGPFEYSTAREQLELIYTSPYGESLPAKLTESSNYRLFVWSKGAVVEEEILQEEEEPATNEEDIRITDFLEMMSDPSNQETSENSDNNNVTIDIFSNEDQIDNESDLIGTQENHFQPQDDDITIDSEEIEYHQSHTPLVNELKFSSINERKQIQLALRMAGLYSGNVDGLFGPQSEAAVSLFQKRYGDEETGTLTPQQQARLFSETENIIGFAESKMLTDDKLGLKIILPTALLHLSEIAYPYVILSPVGFRDINVVLISMDGGKPGLRALYSSLLRHGEIPSEGNQFENDRFRISYSNFEHNFVASARLFSDRIRGVIISWHPDQDYWMKEYSQIIAGSLGEVNRSTRFEFEDTTNMVNNLRLLDQNNNLEPKLSSSGFFVSSDGDILTSYGNVEECSFISADFNQPVEIHDVYPDHDLAHLKPLNRIIPLKFAELKNKPERHKTDVVLSGYSFGGLVKEASITRGKLVNSISDSKSSERYIVEFEVTDGDFGGPILDDTGSVIGMLSRALPQGKILPTNIHMAQTSETMVNLLGEGALDTVTSTKSSSLDLKQISRLARDMTVLIRCF